MGHDHYFAHRRVRVLLSVFAIEGWFPDRTLVLTHDQGGERAKARDGEGSDRIGGRSDEYHHKVETAFRLIAFGSA